MELSDSLFGLSQRSALVTGGASHLGRAICFALGAAGMNVTLVDIDSAQAEKTVHDLRQAGIECHNVVADLTSSESAQLAVAEVVARYGAVDVLVNNLGWNIPEWFSSIDDRTVERSVAINLVAAVTMLQVALPVMSKSEHPAVVTVASDSAFGDVKSAVYGACKAGLISLTKSLALEYGSQGIRLNAVSPGLLTEPGPGEAGEVSVWSRGPVVTDRQKKAILSSIPLGRLSTPQDVAQAVLFFASDLSSQLTGQVLSVSGGYAMP